MPHCVVHHVEMEVVAMMVRHGADRARVTINHAPCGYGQSLAGCHQYLPDFLPPGHTLTVLGTDALGNPFSETYEGKART